MKRVVLLLIILAFAVGTVWGKNYEVIKKVDEYTIKVEIDRNPPIVGNNNVTITISDASGKPVTDAKVKVGYSMPAMSGMPAMNYKTDMILKGNEYMAKVEFSMAGSWNVEIQITQGQKVKKVKFNVDVK
ncbi:MAG: FixH family protein [Deltaproteobacteria bacterium]|nr:FixH family protein [Deltaproteobacteria bacterium]